MIPAKKSKVFDYFFHQFNKRFLRFHFKEVYYAREEQVNLPHSPALFIVNHSTWWDALVVFHLNQIIIKQESYVMMHEKGIREFPFFRKIGAFSVNRDNPKDIVRSMKYAKERLNDGKTLWLFPQGDERHLEIRPLGFLPGAMHITKNTDIPIVPVSLYYTFTGERKPEVYIKLDEPVYYSQLHGDSSKEKNSSLEKHYTLLLDKVKQDVIQQKTSHYQPLL
ncbi:lysophospholipid acyltransferase family protein [Bacillus sp. RO1]|uniref:lysophospholipid acyltransferase family protein n=1 Tax=Bacillus sp. RO1 TaxID=2722703 RepID=UPI0014566C8C|nr:lysophospholipid acyltransferase family protein [Bacillus sp. RO1]NLP49427.1 acyl-phosphate glycerol 3-phosphate acyltransferase [Bacillus sp. RO1]